MIAAKEIAALHGEWLLRHDAIEKDYILGWLLAGIAAHPSLRTWVFKGGTCLRKCYFETYRFSEDLDFTVIDDGVENSDELVPVFVALGEWLYEQCGLRLHVDGTSFRQRKNKRGNPTVRGRIGFSGPLQSPSTPKVTLDITSDELLANAAVQRPVFHPYSDAVSRRGDTGVLAEIASYSMVELMAEKLRALTERCRPRDLYDVVHIYRHPDLLGRSLDVRAALEEKCQFAGIDVPDLETIQETPFRQEIEAEWANMLAHQLPHLPPFEQFWATLDDVFGWLCGTLAVPQLQAVVADDVDESWQAPRTMVTWHTGAPLELIRFAGANRLKVELDYRAEKGRWGPRVVEPYSFRRSREGPLLLYVVNDRGQLRSYAVDLIAGVSVTDESFTPEFAVEF